MLFHVGGEVACDLRITSYNVCYTKLLRDLASLPSEGRVWLLFAHEWWGYGDIERRRMTELLAPRASATETFERPGAWALLFDLGAS